MSILNWRAIAAEPNIHDCDCGYCEMQGETEEKVWPLLAAAKVNGREHITDRRLLLRTEVAPVPENYEGSVMAGPISVEWPEVDESWTSPVGLHFKALHLAELERLGWRVRKPADEPTREGASVRCGVIDRVGAHIGWVMSCQPNGNYFDDNDFSREYEEVAA